MVFKKYLEVRKNSVQNVMGEKKSQCVTSLIKKQRCK